MTHLFLLAQLLGPVCGQYGSTPFNNGAGIGCTVPSATNPYGTRLIENPYVPGTVLAVPANSSQQWSPGYSDQ